MTSLEILIGIIFSMLMASMYWGITLKRLANKYKLRWMRESEEANYLYKQWDSCMRRMELRGDEIRDLKLELKSKENKPPTPWWEK